MAAVNPFHMTLCIFVCFDQLQKTNFHTVALVGITSVYFIY